MGTEYDFVADTLTPLLQAFKTHYDAWDSGLVEPRDAVDFSAVWRTARVEKGITWLKYQKGPEFAKDFDSTITKAIRTYDKLWFRASCIADGWRPESPLPEEGSLDRFAFHHAYVRLQNDLKFAGRHGPEDLARQRLFDFDRRCTLAKRRFWQCVVYLSDLQGVMVEARRQAELRPLGALTAPRPMSEPVWPPDGGWHFRPGGYAFRGKAVKLGGYPLRLLEAAVCSKGPFTFEGIAFEVWGNDQPTGSGFRSTLSNLRSHLRETWGLRSSQDPLPRVDTGAYRFNHDLLNGLSAG